MTLGGHVAEHLDERVDLRRDRRLAGLHEGRREAELPQPGEGLQDRDPVPVEVADQAEHLLAYGGEVPVVQAAMSR